MTPDFIRTNRNKIINYKDDFSSPKLTNYQNAAFSDFDIMKDVKRRFFDAENLIKKEEVIKLFKDNDVYLGVICALIWGGINATRSKDKTNTFFYHLLKYDKNELLLSLKKINLYLENNQFNQAFKFFNDEKRGKIKGIGPAFFTKIFYFLGEGNEAIKIKPLIFDKWTQIAYLALLIQNNEKEKIKKYYSDIQINLLKKPGLVKVNEKNYGECYQSFVEDFNFGLKKLE